MKKNIKKILSLMMILAMGISVNPPMAQADTVKDINICVGSKYEKTYTTSGVEAIPNDTGIVTTSVTGTEAGKTIITYTGVSAGSTTVELTVNGTHAETITVTVGSHSWDAGYLVQKATCTSEGIMEYTCEKCKERRTEKIPKVAHTKGDVPIVDKKATCMEDGQQSYHCTVCAQIIPETIEVIPSLNAGKGHVWDTDYLYDEKPTFTKPGKKSIHCSICYAIKEGTTVTVPKMTLKGTTIKTATNVKTKSIKLKWKEVPQADEYHVQFSTTKAFKSRKNIHTESTGITIKKLKKGKTYYIRVRTVVDDDEEVCSKWSAVRSVKIKK